MAIGDSSKTRNGDYMANERTFLAYLRTSLSFIAFGFVVARFSLFAQEFAFVTHQRTPGFRFSTAFGVAMAAAGIVVALYGALRYARMHTAIADAKAEPMPPGVAAGLGAVLAVIGLAVGAALLTVK
jgi:putative membrane protein